MKMIPLTKGKTAFVDDADYDWLNQWKWHVNYESYGGGKWYAETAIKGSYVQMHRLVLGAPRGVIVDHINGDGLDNRRVNLRLCNMSENMQNRGPQRNNKSGYKGVSRHHMCNKYMAFIKVGKKQMYLGLFETPEEAAHAYDKAAKKYHREFAYLNFPEQ